MGVEVGATACGGAQGGLPMGVGWRERDGKFFYCYICFNFGKLTQIRRLLKHMCFLKAGFFFSFFIKWQRDFVA